LANGNIYSGSWENGGLVSWHPADSESQALKARRVPSLSCRLFLWFTQGG
jgi:hypothetical protein